jgi:uncharacterized protein YdeI (YjbR/CyaY-like superfamily)
MVRLRVVVEVAGERFKTSLFAGKKVGRGGHFLLVNKNMQAAAGTGVGAIVEFRMWPDLEERKAVITPELAEIFKAEKDLKRWYETQLTDSTRWAIRKWMDEAKEKEAKVRRAEQMAERLMETMEAEISLPPLIATALRRRPGAIEGWEKMTPGRRQALLMAVFYYRTPESRAKRVEKVVEECLGKA